jgi:hypothetical protein
MQLGSWKSITRKPLIVREDCRSSKLFMIAPQTINDRCGIPFGFATGKKKKSVPCRLPRRTVGPLPRGAPGSDVPASPSHTAKRDPRSHPPPRPHHHHGTHATAWTAGPTETRPDPPLLPPPQISKRAVGDEEDDACSAAAGAGGGWMPPKDPRRVE